jgi:hypothetical protein
VTFEKVLTQAIAALQRYPSWVFVTTRAAGVEEKGTVSAEGEGTHADMEEGHHALSTVSACESCGSTVL